MKKILFFALCLITLSTAAFGQTATLSFNDNSGVPDSGTYNATTTFTLDVNLTLSGFDSAGLIANSLTYFLQVPDALAPFISITSNSYFTFTDSTQPTVPKTFTSTSGANSGFMTDEIPSTMEAGDLGATALTAAENRGDGFYHVTSITFALNGAPAGTYSLLTTTANPKTSVVGDTTFGAGTVIPSAAYTITIVPEPSTLSFIVLGGLGAMGLTTLRRRHRV